MLTWPISLDDVTAARERIRRFLPPTPLRSYATLDDAVGHDIRVHVKHENFQPTGAFKIRNALSLVTALPEHARAGGLVAASRGNHGLGLAWAGREFGVSVTVVVPRGNNPDKNAGMRALGATVVEEGADYDEAAAAAASLATRTGAYLAHSTNDRLVLAGAATLALEVLEQEPALDTLVVAVGGGSQAVGALTVARAHHRTLRVVAVQAEGADAAYQSWTTGRPVSSDRADTFADGLATRGVYELTFGTLRAGLAGFVTVSDDELADSLRLLLRCTHTLVEGAGAAGLAGLRRLAPDLSGQRVGIILSGGNIDEATLRRVLSVGG